MTCIEIGTSLISCSRLCAVTVTVSSTRELASASAFCSGLSGAAEAVSASVDSSAAVAVSASVLSWAAALAANANIKAMASGWRARRCVVLCCMVFSPYRFGFGGWITV